MVSLCFGMPDTKGMHYSSIGYFHISWTAMAQQAYIGYYANLERATP